MVLVIQLQTSARCARQEGEGDDIPFGNALGFV